MAGVAILAGSARLAVWRLEAADEATYILATRQCLAAREQDGGSAAAEFWCRRARQLHASLGHAKAERLTAEPMPAGVEGRPSLSAGDGPTSRELVAARAAAMWGRLDGR